MPDFGIANLRAGEAYTQPGSFQKHGGVLGEQRCEKGRMRQCDRIRFVRRRNTKTIKDDEDNGAGFERHGDGARIAGRGSR